MALSRLQSLFPPTFEFRENRRRKVNYRLSLLIKTRALRKRWKKYDEEISDYPNTFQGRGIVICGGGPVYFTCAWININMLRNIGCKLPIELWHLEHELTEELIEMLEKLDVSCKNINEYGGGHLENYALKPFSIINSSFLEVLFLDADNNCLKDPSFLFDSAEYQENGAVFWPDFWITEKTNPIWKVLDIQKRELQEQESGQILINKEKCWKELNLCLHFNMERKYYYRMLLGDKDTFQLAWLALGSDYHMITTPVGFCGHNDEKNGLFHSTSMVQHDYDGNNLFIHRNIIKWFYTPPDQLVWSSITTFKPNAQDRRIIEHREDGKMYINIAGDIKKTPVSPAIVRYEKECLDLLKRLRSTKAFLQFIYLNQNT
ncbi:MAG: hypothetical protein AB8B56_20500 [Crocinitomicaceae bacterium]